MKHKTWFRLVLKAIGVLLIGISLPQLTGIIIWIARQATFGRAPWIMTTPPGIMPITGTLGPIADYLLGILPHLMQFAFGLYLLLGGAWIVNKVIPSNRPYCPECGYDLSKREGDRCPECGVPLTPDIRRAADAGSTTGEKE